MITLTTALVVLVSAYLMLRIMRRSGGLDALFWWPLLLYLPGPIGIYLLFSEHPIFDSYFSEASVFAVSLALVGGAFIYLITLSRATNELLKSELYQISDSAFGFNSNWPVYALGFACISVQAALLQATGASIFSGTYILGDGSFQENSGLFTMAAGLYEIFAAVVALKLLLSPGALGRNKGLALFAVLVLALRMLGGTRLIILKLVIFSLGFAYLRGRIRHRSAIVGMTAFIALLMLVGSLRSGDDESTGQLLFLILSEPALGTLSATLVSDHAIRQGFWINSSALTDAAGYVMFIIIHLIPSAIYNLIDGRLTYLGEWGYYRTAAESFYPFRQILLETGLETVSPVGGQSIVALGTAIFGAAGAALMLPFLMSIFVFVRRIVPKAIPLMLVVAFEAPSIYRDSTEIFVKQVFVICVGYWVLMRLSAISIPRPSGLGIKVQEDAY